MSRARDKEEIWQDSDFFFFHERDMMITFFLISLPSLKFTIILYLSKQISLLGDSGLFDNL